MTALEAFMKRRSVLALQHLTTFLLTYRLPVYVLTFLLIVAPLRYQYVVAHLEIVFVALCFTSLMAFIYLLNKVTDQQEDAINTHSGPILESARKPTLVISVVCLIAPLLYLVFLPAYLPWYAAVAVLGYFYSKPLPFGRPPHRLKEMLLVKSITSAVIFALPSSGVYHITIPGYSLTDFWIHFLGLFLFSFMVELLWDVRDIEGDRAAGVRTIANTYGVRATQILAVGSFGLFLLLFGIFRHPYIAAFLIAVSVAFILGTSPRRSAWFYHSILLVWIGVLAVVFFL